MAVLLLLPLAVGAVTGMIVADCLSLRDALRECHTHQPVSYSVRRDSPPTP